MTARNEITGDKIQTKVNSQEYRDNFDRIFSKDSEKELVPVIYLMGNQDIEVFDKVFNRISQ